MTLNLTQKPCVLEPKQPPMTPHQHLELQRALKNPLGSRRIGEIASTGNKVSIVINDVTRPMPSGRIVKMLLTELRSAGVQSKDVTVIVGTGVHRACSDAELSAMLGNAVKQNVSVKNHDCKDSEDLVNLGKTRRGVPVILSKTVAEADIKILTGMITPHHVAGYSGGRKSIMPGVAGLEALRIHHSQKFRPIGPAMGVLKNNLFHEEAEEAAEITEVDFIVNVVLNSKKQIIRGVAGDLKEAWQGVSASENIYAVDAPSLADVVITSPGGYPKDINLWQAQKAISSAEMLVRKGGTIVLVAECEEGFGEHTFSRFFENTASPAEVIEKFNRRGYEPGLSKAFMYARALENAEIIIVSDKITDAELTKVYTKRASSIDRAFEMAKNRLGQVDQIVVMPHATEIVPRIKQE